MNNAHEPGLNGDSETIPGRKTRSKTKPGARAPKTGPAGHTGAHRRAHAWPCRERYGRVVAELPGRVAACMAVSQAPPRRVAGVCARRHSRIVVCLTTHYPASSSPSCRNTLYCIAMQFQPNQTAAIQYTVLQYSLLFAHLRPPCHDTLSVL